jgi:hypothetical protein
MIFDVIVNRILRCPFPSYTLGILVRLVFAIA